VAAAPIGDLPGRLTELPPGPVLVMIGRVFSDIEAVMPRESAASGTSQHLEGGAKSISYVP
jgi:hypothetical protein